MTRNVFIALIVLSIMGGGFYAYGNARYKQGVSDAETACADKRAKEAQHVAKDLANRPRTVNDAVKRLRDRAADKR